MIFISAYETFFSINFDSHLNPVLAQFDSYYAVYTFQSEGYVFR